MKPGRRTRSGSPASRITAPRHVESGLDVLVSRRFAPLKGLSVGVICNPTAVDKRLRHIADLLHASARTHVVALFAPEHGVRGDAAYMAAVADERDSTTGVVVHSLYGSSADSLRPTDTQLRGIDALVFDIQDVGARYYTYQATMLLCMEAAARAKIRFVVLDRPNPIGGVAVEGPRLRTGFESFCGLHDIAPRHGMTVGELASLYRQERGLTDLELVVVECRGWRRRTYQRETGLPWVFPSPNMPTAETALVYPGMCLLEGTNLSEGRGTTRPFELFGAPWLDSGQLADELQALELPGVAFRPASFQPSFDKHAGKRCHGAELFVTDRSAFRPFRTGIACIAAARSLVPEEFRWRRETYEFVGGIPAFDLLAGSSREREAIETGVSLRQMERWWVPEERAFAIRRRPFLRYA